MCEDDPEEDGDDDDGSLEYAHSVSSGGGGSQTDFSGVSWFSSANASAFVGCNFSIARRSYTTHQMGTYMHNTCHVPLMASSMRP